MALDYQELAWAGEGDWGGLVDGWWGLRIDTGAEPSYMRCLAERCEPNVGLAMGQLAVRDGSLECGLSQTAARILARAPNVPTALWLDLAGGGLILRFNTIGYPDPRLIF
jgi:hypothetical protein